MEADVAPGALTWPLSVEPRPYQTEALERMVERGNQLLALTMGAGKTLTALGAVELLAAQGHVRTGFVFCPNSIKFQWLDEVRRRTGAPCQVIDGTKEQRLFQYKHARRYRYNISNYDTVRNDVELLTNWVAVPDFVIADEATQIKSMRARRSKVLKKLARDVPYRFALTGQPIENRPEELFSIMEFVDRTVLGPFIKFDRTFILRDHFGRPVRYRNMETLVEAMRPVMYRKSRKDIEEYLPTIIPMEMSLDLPPAVRDVYDFMAHDCLNAIENAIEMGGMGGFNVAEVYGRSENESSKGKAMGEIMSRLTCMRMLCDHPALLLASAQEYDDPESSRGSKYAAWLQREGFLDGVLEGGDEKLLAAADLVEEVLNESPANRVVLFSFFKPMLRMLRAVLGKRGVGTTMLTGDLNAQQRRASLASFQGPIRCLLSSDAGQYGIDLPHVNYLVSYDLPWSAGAFAQRVARIDRTSSLFPHVTVITMMCRGTVEQRQFDMLSQKRTVAEAWIDGQHIDAKGGLTLTLDTLREFLQAA
jgi:SNF2 family DNA or RNA helicase